MDDSARPTAPTAAEAEVPELPDQHTALPPSPARRAAGPTRRLIARWPRPVQQVLRLLWWTATLRLVGRLRQRRLSRDYRAWTARYDTIDENDRGVIARDIASLSDPPMISVMMPVYQTPEPFLRAAIDSVRQQLYPHWQLCIADDASTERHVRAVLEHYREIDRRIEICYRCDNGHVSAASNSALDLAKGEFVALLDHDDLLPEHALYLARTSPERIRHIPHVLYHQRAVSGSAVRAPVAKNSATERARQAIADFLTTRRIDAQVVPGDLPHCHRVRYALRELPLVSAIIPTRDQAALLRTCVTGLLDRTDYPNLEIIIIDNRSREPDTHAYFAELAADPRVRIVGYDKPYNYAAINNFAAGLASGSMLCLLNNDIEIIHSDWLREMVSHALRPGVGGVGALLYYPDDRVQHAGTILGLGGVAGHPYRWQPRGAPGYLGRARVIQNLSAVTAACFVVPAKVFAEVGGFDDRNLTIAYNDVDLCLRIGERGYRIVWTPHAELYHHESASRGPDTDPDKRNRFAAEMAHMRRRWGAVLQHDPCYNPNLWLNGHDWGLASPPRIGKLAIAWADERTASRQP